MKKAFLFLASAALLMAGCAKVENEEIVPTPETGKRIVTLNAGVDNSGTRVSVDESTHDYSWQAGEEISVLINGSKLTKSSATNVSGNSAKFQVELESGESIGDYAYSPADATWWNDSNSIGLAASHDYVEGATFMPMLGTISTDKKSITFKAIGGVIKLTISNIPSNAESLVFSAYGKRITGTFAISDGMITAENQTGNGDVTINFAGKQSSTMAFFIPLPTGTYSGFELQFRDASNNDITYAGKKVQFGGSDLPVRRSEVIVAPELELVKPDYSGEWIMVGKKIDDYYACPAYTSGNNIHGIQVTVNGNVVTSNNQAIKMTITKVSSDPYKDMYTIQDSNNQYLYMAGANSNNYLKGESNPSNMDGRYYWDITPDGNGGFSIVSKGTGSHNILKFNTSNLLFSCYDSSSDYPNVSLYSWDDAVIETPEPSGDVWTLVTDASDLAAGDVIVFASNEWNAVAGPLSGDYLTKVDAVFSNDLGTIDNLPSNALQFTLGGSTNAWTLTTDAGQMYSTSLKLRFSQTDSHTWAISISDNNAYVSYGDDILKYNSGSPRFKTYAASSNLANIQIYRKQTAPESRFATENTSNVTLGTGNSFNSSACSVIINNQTVNGAKVGSGSNGGSVRITVPQGTKVLHLHLAGWKDGVVKVDITRTTAGTSVGETLTLKADSGVTGNGTYTLEETDASKFYHAVTLSNSETGLPDDLTLDISSAGTSGERRFIIWGVNAEQ